MKTAFVNENDMTDVWMNYIQNEALALSQMEDEEIDEFADREIDNPDMQEFLDSLPEMEEISTQEDSFSASLAASSSEAVSLFGGKFRKLKRKIRQILCSILGDVGSDDTLNWKDIIKAALVALIPALGGGPLSLIILPILISLVAKIVKRGMNAVCPVAA